MPKPKYGHGVDKEHHVIKEALERSGYYVRDMAGVGDDFPDLLVVSKADVIVLMEIKTPGESATRGQISFLFNFPGPVSLVYSIEDALEFVSKYD